jgi:hypothetical protein
MTNPGYVFFLLGCVLLDVLAELEVEVQRLVDAGVEHLQPVAGGLLEVGHVEQVAGLDDDLRGRALRESPAWRSEGLCASGRWSRTYSWMASGSG